MICPHCGRDANLTGKSLQEKPSPFDARFLTDKELAYFLECADAWGDEKVSHAVRRLVDAVHGKHKSVSYCATLFGTITKTHQTAAQVKRHGTGLVRRFFHGIKDEIKSPLFGCRVTDSPVGRLFYLK